MVLPQSFHVTQIAGAALDALDAVILLLGIDVVGWSSNYLSKVLFVQFLWTKRAFSLLKNKKNVPMSLKYLLLLLLTINFYLCSSCLGQSNVNCIDSTNLNSSFKISIGELSRSNKKIILLGESHGVSITNALFNSLIQSFSESNSCSIICERSYAEAILYNKFLESKNQDYLKFDVAWSVEMRDFFNSLYDYNKSLPQEKKLRFIGIDAIHSKNAFILAIQILIPNKQPPQEISPLIDSLKRLVLPVSFKNLKAKNYFSLLDELLSYFKNEVEKHHSIYKEYFAENFVHIQEMINSKSSYSNPGKRDSEMFNNLVRILNDQQIKTSFIGLFGQTHVMNLKAISKSFGEAVSTSEKSPFKGQVLRILIQYENCKADFQGKEVKVPSLLASIMGKKETAFKAKVKSNLRCGDFVIKSTEENSSLYENCDYLIFVSDKPAVMRF